MPILGVVAGSDINAPAAPIIGTATDVGTSRAYNNGAATVTFTVGASKLPITSFTATSNPGGFSATGASSPITVQGLQSGVSYTFTVTATNAVGTSSPSAASNSITATTVPQAPTIGTASRTNDTTVSLSFTANATGGKAISSYSATSSPSISLTTTGTSSPVSVTGSYASNQSYTFTLRATNANGSSDPSGASNGVIPNVPKPVVTGGTLTSDATYYYRTFTSSGTLGVTNATLTADYLVVAGGAGGSPSQRYNCVSCGITYDVSSAGGAGGAGGFREFTSQSLAIGNYSITVGAGGSGRANGSNSAFCGSTSTGGARGGVATLSAFEQAQPGGSGGGGYSYAIVGLGGGAGSAGAGNTPSVSPSQGNSGGTGHNAGTTQGNIGAGGGGGIGSVGGNGAAATGGNGGSGATSSIAGNSIVYSSGGGGGGGSTGGIGGSNAGNGGGTSSGGSSASANRGGGGGGGGRSISTGTSYNGGNGGSGVVIVRYTRSQVD